MSKQQLKEYLEMLELLEIHDTLNGERLKFCNAQHGGDCFTLDRRDLPQKVSDLFPEVMPITQLRAICDKYGINSLTMIWQEPEEEPIDSGHSNGINIDWSN